MASFRVEGFDDLIKKLNKLSDKAKIDEAAKKAVNEAKGVVADSMKAAIRASEYGPRSIGSVAKSIQPTEGKVNSYGVYSVARPTGRDDKGVRNGEKAAYLEYGTSNMSARPWRSKAVSDAEPKAQKIVENVIRKEMELE